MALFIRLANYEFAVDGSGERFVSVFLDEFDSQLKVIRSSTYVELSTSGVPVGTQIYSGNDLPYTIPSGQYTDYQYCDGSTLVAYQYKSQFPYVERVDIPNSGSCIITGATCDLAINTVNYEYDSGYDITIQASSSNGIIEYSLNNTDWQYSNQFTGLDAGDYIVYTRDNEGCKKQTSINLPDRRTYGQRYEYEFTDRLEQTVTVKIYEKDYSGSVSIVNEASVVPIYIDWNSQGNTPETVIKSKRAIFEPLSEISFEWLDITTGSKFDYKVEIEIDGTLDFQGYLMPNLYEERYINAPYFSRLEFTDGLVYLKDIDFPEMEGNLSLLEVLSICVNDLQLSYDLYESINIYETRMNDTNNNFVTKTFSISSVDGNLVLSRGVDETSFFEAGQLVKIVNDTLGSVEDILILDVEYDSPNTLLTLDWDVTGLTGYETSTAVTKNHEVDSVFEQAHINAQLFKDKTKYEVLEMVLKPFFGTIWQQNGDLYCVNFAEFIGDLTIRQFDLDSLQKIQSFSATRYEDSIDGTTTHTFINGTQYLNYDYAVNNIIVNLDLDYENSLLLGAEFTDDAFEGDRLRYWQGDAITAKRAGDDDELSAVSISGFASTVETATYIKQSFKLESNSQNIASQGSEAEFSFKYKLIYPSGISDSDIQEKPKLYVKVKTTTTNPFLEIQDFTPYTFWIKNDGVSVTTASEDYLEFEISDVNEWLDYSVTIPFFSYNTETEVTFYQCVSPDYEIEEIRFTEIKYIYYPEKENPENEIQYEFPNLDYDHQSQEKEIEINLGDVPQFRGNNSIYNGTYKLVDGRATNEWYQRGITENRPLGLILANNILRQYKKPFQRITGELYQIGSDRIQEYTVITDTAQPTKEFLLNYYVYDYRNNKFDAIELIELSTEKTYNVFGIAKNDGTYITMNNGKLIGTNET